VARLRPRWTVSAALLAATLLFVAPQTRYWQEAPPLPDPVSNNAVAAVETADGASVFSFLGIDSTRAWDGVVNAAYRWTVSADVWTEVAPVPGPGRLAATAQAVGGRVYVFGGYTVAEDGSEKSLPNVDIYDPDGDTWRRGADIPLPVDDAVSGVWRDSLIYLVSGWHDTGNVDRVQIYDPATDTWQQGTPIPGTPVFGHAGAIAGDAIVYTGGARVTGGSPRYAIEPSAWRGDIDPGDPTLIHWRSVPMNPGPALYRAAGGSILGYVVFAGGTTNPYNYDGIGYDGVAAEPEPGVFAYEVERERWVELAAMDVPTMDHRTIALLPGGRLVLVGGMEAGQRVTRRVAFTR